MLDNLYVRLFETLGSDNVALVGGKNASLGEMIVALKDEGIRIPGGYATTAKLYRDYIEYNDLTQFTLGMDRDAETLSDLFDERHPVVKSVISDLIERAHERDRPVGTCGQAPSDYPEFTEFLAENDIDSISVNPDSVIPVKKKLADYEKKNRK